MNVFIIEHATGKCYWVIKYKPGAIFHSIPEGNHILILAITSYLTAFYFKLVKKS